MGNKTAAAEAAAVKHNMNVHERKTCKLKNKFAQSVFTANFLCKGERQRHATPPFPTCATLHVCVFVCVSVVYGFLQLFIFCCCCCCCAKAHKSFCWSRQAKQTRCASARLLSADELRRVCVCVRVCAWYFPAFGPAISMKAIKHTRTHTRRAPLKLPSKRESAHNTRVFPPHTHTHTH